MKKITKKKVKFILKDNSKKYSFASIDIKNDLSFIFCPSFLTSGHTTIGKFDIHNSKKIEQIKQPPQEIPKGIHFSLHPNLENNPKRKQEFHIKNNETNKQLAKKDLNWHPVQRGIEIFRFFYPYSHTYLKEYSKNENNTFYIPIQDVINMTQSILLRATVYPLNTDRQILLSDIQSFGNQVFEHVPNEGVGFPFWYSKIDCVKNEKQIGYTILFSFHRVHINDHPMFLWS